MSGESGGFRFVSHQRTGLIAVPAVAAGGTVDVAAVFADGTSTTAVTLTLPGPADVLGLDTTLVQRQYPRPGTTDAETEFFPLVEFRSRSWRGCSRRQTARRGRSRGSASSSSSRATASR